MCDNMFPFVINRHKKKMFCINKRRFIKKHFVISIIFTNFAKCYDVNAAAAYLAERSGATFGVNDEKQ